MNAETVPTPVIADKALEKEDQKNLRDKLPPEIVEAIEAMKLVKQFRYCSDAQHIRPNSYFRVV